MTDELMVTTDDLASLRYCRKGARDFFARHGLSWERMLNGGVPASELERIDDAMVRAAIERARQRVESEKRGLK